MKVSVVGSGSWGSALAIHLSSKGINVTMCAMTPETYKEISTKRENSRALPGVKIPDDIIITDDLEKAVKEADIIILAVASVYTRATAAKMSEWVKKGAAIVEVGKGIEEDTLLMLKDVVAQEIPQANVAVLSGPSHAEELSKGMPTTCVISADDKDTALLLQELFMSDTFRIYDNPDSLGISVGGALKNVIALAAGIADGIGYGDNTKAALITRGIEEISRLGESMGAKKATFSGLSGIGDLIVTCASMHSRNRRAGILIGQGKSPEEAMKDVNMVVEGVYAAKAAKCLADKYGVEMPIVNEVNKVLFEGKEPSQAVNDLMIRDKISEISSVTWPSA